MKGSSPRGREGILIEWNIRPGETGGETFGDLDILVEVPGGIILKMVVIALATMYRIAHCGKTHHDILTTWLIGVSYPMLELLRKNLEEVL